MHGCFVNLLLDLIPLEGSSEGSLHRLLRLWIAGVVRLSLGDNEEMGGANRGGGVYWNFLHDATVSAGDQRS